MQTPIPPSFEAGGDKAGRPARFCFRRNDSGLNLVADCTLEDVGYTLSGGLIVTLGFALGCIGMLILDKAVPHEHEEQHIVEGPATRLSRPMLLVLAVALHNIPEGIALGVVISSAMQDKGLSWTAAVVFSLGLAIQMPEGLR